MSRVSWLVSTCLVVGACSTSAPRSSTPVGNQASAPPPGIEHWTGTGREIADGTEWTMDLVFDASAPVGAHVGTIAYPSLHCSGELTREPDRGDDLVAREAITINLDHLCADGGAMIIPRHRGATFHWRWQFAGGSDGAAATLSRTR